MQNWPFYQSYEGFKPIRQKIPSTDNIPVCDLFEEKKYWTMDTTHNTMKI